MDDKYASNVTYLATLIAVELSRDKSVEEIIEIRTLLSQVVSTLSTLSLFKAKK